ncbi:hypothetical protein BpHYR1_020478 [Brachionus plicatilis]|uniref:Uncharacterized protein n=1 Tax=Brachionus plicatilis TaxID=10195 RepID=A0A3M7Q1X7_BRAPC|nr:hypothetical protein BpHYR1_020478 [Brachionus plicatilis]
MKEYKNFVTKQSLIIKKKKELLDYSHENLYHLTCFINYVIEKKNFFPVLPKLDTNNFFNSQCNHHIRKTLFHYRTIQI